MTHIFQKSPYRLVAQFPDEMLAETVCDAINDALSAAARQTNRLFEKQGGVADISDVSAIYTRHGFRNESGWQQFRPLTIDNDFILWEIPEGMNVEDAEGLLAGFGAISMMVENEAEDDLLRQVPHPSALFLTEFDEGYDPDEDEIPQPRREEKKTLH